jgi:hypothetical protein
MTRPRLSQVATSPYGRIRALARRHPRRSTLERRKVRKEASFLPLSAGQSLPLPSQPFKDRTGPLSHTLLSRPPHGSNSTSLLNTHDLFLSVYSCSCTHSSQIPSCPRQYADSGMSALATSASRFSWGRRRARWMSPGLHISRRISWHSPSLRDRDPLSKAISLTHHVLSPKGCRSEKKGGGSVSGGAD